MGPRRSCRRSSGITAGRRRLPVDRPLPAQQVEKYLVQDVFGGRRVPHERAGVRQQRPAMLLVQPAYFLLHAIESRLNDTRAAEICLTVICLRELCEWRL